MALSPETKLAFLWCALGHAAKSRANRDLIEVGSETSLKIAIEAKIGRLKVADSLEGVLSVDEDSTKARQEKAPIERVVAMLLDELPTEAAKAAAMERIKNRWDSYNALPDVSVVDAAKVAAWLNSLSTPKQVIVKGNLVFACKD